MTPYKHQYQPLLPAQKTLQQQLDTVLKEFYLVEILEDKLDRDTDSTSAGRNLQAMKHHKYRHKHNRTAQQRINTRREANYS